MPPHSLGAVPASPKSTLKILKASRYSNKYQCMFTMLHSHCQFQHADKFKLETLVLKFEIQLNLFHLISLNDIAVCSPRFLSIYSTQSEKSPICMNPIRRAQNVPYSHPVFAIPVSLPPSTLPSQSHFPIQLSIQSKTEHLVTHCALHCQKIQ